MPVVMACLSMGKQKVGALIVIEHTTPLDEVVRTGEIIDAAISQRLIENIFFKNSPLHDGAMVISKKRIKAAGCILPVSHDLNILKELGLRHRAAMGISQKSDAHAIIVSEETGAISVAYRGQFYLRLNAEELESLLTKEKLKLNISEHGQTKFSKNRRYSSTRIIGDRFCYGSDYPGCIGRRRS